MRIQDKGWKDGKKEKRKTPRARLGRTTTAPTHTRTTDYLMRTRTRDEEYKDSGQGRQRCWTRKTRRRHEEDEEAAQGILPKFEQGKRMINE